jgi:hypothetical protein
MEGGLYRDFFRMGSIPLLGITTIIPRWYQTGRSTVGVMDKIVDTPHCGFDMSLLMISVVSHVECFLFQNRALTEMYV